MNRLVSVATTVVAVLITGTACARPGRQPSAGPPPATGAASTSASTSPATGSPPATGGGGGSTVNGPPFRVTYGWGVPSTLVTVSNPVPVPPVPYLVEVRTGDHPEENPGYTRITFAFRGAFPAYRFSYVERVTADGSGAPVPLPGNAALQIVFTPAQAHDDAGASTIGFASDRTFGLHHLAGYAPAGDYEGYVTYGLGIQVAPGSDETPLVRTGQLTRPDPNGPVYVVAVDIRY